MSFLYPRTVSIRRQNIPAEGVAGIVKFGGNQAADEQVIATGLPASIQYDREGIQPRADLPADNRRSQWRIIIPLSAPVSLGDIQKDDTVVDDLGIRYQVIAPYWNSLGYGLRAEQMAV
jgi:hypothetical protein